MQASPVNKISFGRAFSTKERMQADKVRKEALKLLGCDRVAVIIPEFALQSEAGKDIGVGQLNTPYNENFYKFLRSYTGANTIKILPHGEYAKSAIGFYSAYKTSALTLGTQMINLEELASPDMGNILSKETLKNVCDGAVCPLGKNIAHFENVVGAKTKHEKALFEAFKNFTVSKSERLVDLKKQFEKYKKENFEIIEKRALFECLEEEHGTHLFEKWPDLDKYLFNPDIISEEARNQRISELRQKYAEKIKFTFFKQFLAEKNLAKARATMHRHGFKLTGDCLIGFVTDELWAYPKAFEKAKIGSKDWGLVALNFADVLTAGSESNKLLKLKIAGFARRYDNIRFDVGWSYINPLIFAQGDDAKLLDGRYVYDGSVGGYRVKKSLGGKVLDFVESIVKDVKGADYNRDNLWWEIEAGPNEFSAYDWNKGSLIEPLKGRTIVQSNFYMNNGYATIDMLENRMHIPRNNYFLMAGNHDHLSLNALAHQIDTDSVLGSMGNDVRRVFADQCAPLARDLKLQETTLRNSSAEFIKAKFAYNFLAQNIKIFFMDIFGRSEQFDSQIKNGRLNYCQRIASDYERALHSAIQDGSGLNIMDALAKSFRAKGLDASNKKLYEKLLKFAEILYEKGALSEAEANKLSKKIGRKTIIGAAVAVTAGVVGYLKVKKIKSEQQK